MKLLLPFFFSIFCISIAQAQETVADFENFDLPQDTFLNGSDQAGGFRSGNVFLPNTYTVFPTFESWIGWSVSTDTDTTTRGFTNQYSAITGSGFESNTYAVAFGNTTLQLEGDSQGQPVRELYLTNSTYAYWSIVEGDDFTKRFGGIDGTDPDFFVVTIKAFRDGELLQDSIDFYLADYRFENSEDDYVVDEWTRVELSQFGGVDSLQFTFNSSDVGNYGINTPLYVCVDNIVTNARALSTTAVSVPSIQVYPNPTSEVLRLDWEMPIGVAFIFDATGQLVRRVRLQQGTNELPIRDLVNGIYYLELRDAENRWRSTFVKR